METKQIRTKLRFKKSENADVCVAFVKEDPITNRTLGVRQEDKCMKKICLTTPRVTKNIIPGILYDAVIIPMGGKNKGFICVEATPATFNAKIELSYVPKAIYKVEIKAGKASIVFDPLYGKKDSMKTISGVVEILKNRLDIKNIKQVINDFLDNANLIMHYYEKDKMQLRRLPQPQIATGS